MNDPIGELLAPNRLMMTPGPCSIDPRVYRALSTPLVGHLDPWFTEMIGEVQALLRTAFQTKNRLTFPISASGSGGIEAAVVNPLEPGDEAIVCVNGNFSERMAVIASRTTAKIHRVEAPPRPTGDPEDIRRMASGRKIKIIPLFSIGVKPCASSLKKGWRPVGSGTSKTNQRSLPGWKPSVWSYSSRIHPTACPRSPA